jgi:hypothetical protein
LEYCAGIATVYGLYDRGSIAGRNKRFFTTEQNVGSLWSPHTFLTNEYKGLFPRWKSGQGVKLITLLHIVPSSRNVQL